MWVTAATGEMLSKDAAAAWAAARLPPAEASVLRRAANAYVAGGDEDWASVMPAAHDVAARLAEEVRREATGRAS
jgi:streptomycin 3"-adenylyltransferase